MIFFTKYTNMLKLVRGYHKLEDQCSCLTLAFNIPGSGGDVGGLTDTFETEGGTCDWYMPDMLEPSPPSVTLSVIISICGLWQNFIALRT